MTPATIKRLTYLLAISNVVIIVVMQVMGNALKPGGIIPFEFAWSVGQVQTMIASWQVKGVMHVLNFLLGFDYLFMLTYSSFLSLICLQLAASFTPNPSRFFLILAWLQPVAALLDAIENFALYQSANGSSEEFWPRLAYICAIPKFAIVLTAILSWISISIVRLVKPNVL
jgi:hypothetical protein